MTAEPLPLSLGTEAARNLATTTKTPPQMRAISSRWLIRVLPWEDVPGGTFRVNRRLVHEAGLGRVAIADLRIVAPTLRELPMLAGFEDEGVLAELAAAYIPRVVRPGDVLAEAGAPVSEVYVVAYGRLRRTAAGAYGSAAELAVAVDGDPLGDWAPGEDDPRWPVTVTAATSGTVLVARRSDLRAVLGRSPELRAHIGHYLARGARPANGKGEAAIQIASGHSGEPLLPGTFVEYELRPREYGLSAAQTLLKVHTRVSDLYNGPFDQYSEQLRLTVEALRERQERDLVNDPAFGLMHATAPDQRISARSGPPTPDDLDDLISMRRSTRALLAHPKAIAAFFRECNRRGLNVGSTLVNGRQVPAWRGVPMFPCGKIPVTGHTSSILAMRTGLEEQGVVGLHKIGLDGEHEPGLSVRPMGIDERAIASYLVTAYFSVAILVPDACGLLENVDVATRD